MESTGKLFKGVQRVLVVLVMMLFVCLALILAIVCYSPKKTSSTTSLDTEYSQNTISETLSLKYFENGLESRFGSEEFECSGSCYCFDEHERRSTLLGTSVSRSVKVLLTAFSAVMAVNLAKESFKSDCEKELSDMCEFPQKIHSEVDNCVKMEKDKDIPLKLVKEGHGDTVHVKEEDVTEEMREKSEKYICKGHCVHYSEEVGSQRRNSCFFD
jgi:hypothetical protein